MTEVDPELEASINEAFTTYAPTTTLELTDAADDVYPVAVTPWGAVVTAVDFTKDQLIWLETALSHSLACEDCYHDMHRLAFSWFMGVIMSARQTYPSIDFPFDEVGVAPMSRVESGEDIARYMGWEE